MNAFKWSQTGMATLLSGKVHGKVLVGAFAALLSLAGCEATGPTGATGAAGQNGSNGANGAPGASGKSCAVKANTDGSATIACEDGTTVTLPAGKAGLDGKNCSVVANPNGSKTISCPDGSTVTVYDGQNGKDGAPCTVADDGAGTKTINCPGSPTATVHDGKDGVDGKDGAQGPKGESGDPASAKGTINGKVTAAADGSPLAGALVTSNPLSLQVKSGADGTFALTGVPIGAYQLTVSLAGYTTTQINNVGVVALNTTNVGAALAADSKTGGAPAIVVASDLLAGYDANVALKATVTDPDSDAAKLSYQWAQTGGLPVALTNATSNTLTFKTLSLPKSKTFATPIRFGVVGISPDDAGHYTFSLTVKDLQGHSSTANVTVMAAAPGAGLRNVTLGLPVYLQGDATVTSWNWTLDTTGAPGSTAKLVDATTQFPHFTPDAKGAYVLTETVAKMSLTVYAGSWAGMYNGTEVCKACHNNTVAPDPFADWAKTNHLQGSIDKFNAVKGGAYFGQACLECHTVGYSPFVDNGGFDDVQKNNGWVFKPAAGNWDALQKDHPDLGKLAGVQCENCHGPNNSQGHSSSGMGKTTAVVNDLHFARVSMSTAVCAQCHQEGPHHYKPAQWQTSGHANPALADRGTFEASGTNAAHCGRCHAAQGFVLYADQLSKGISGNLVKADGSAADEAWLRANGLQRSTVEPQTCQTCHDPHSADHPAQVRLYDNLPVLPNGMTGITGAGTGATCMACHNTRNGEHTDFVAATTSTSGPHAPAQTDVLYGFNAYFMPRFTPSKHLAVTDTCAACHVKIPTEAQVAEKETANHAFKPDEKVCVSCHAANVDGKALKGVIAMQMNELGQSIGAAAKVLAAQAIAANGKLVVRANNGNGLYSSSSSTTYNVDLTDVPTSIEAKYVGTSFFLWFTMPKAISITWTDNTTTSVTQFGVSWTALQTPVAGKNAPVIAAGTTVFKGIWNMQLLHNDKSNGLHNPTFFSETINATKAAMAAVK
ncbi:MAG: carboxypeptidase regulatory-like domain-containing protein [Deltaproteobacteria bacterium]|nr:carboxypeptidase regulatory-like domain-containing protein [Deltaproteobacteria bacterium]